MDTNEPELIEVRRDEWEAVLTRLARLEANATAPAGESAQGAVVATEQASADEDRSFPRRKLLAGLAAAAAGGAALTVLDASPAAAEVVIAGTDSTTSGAFQANNINPYNGPTAWMNNAVPASGAINANAYAALAMGPNGLQARASREGIGIDATSPTGTAVRATLGNAAPSTAAAVRAVTFNGIGLKADVSGNGDGAVVTSAFGRGIVSRSARPQLALAPYSPTAGPPTQLSNPVVAGELYVDGAGKLWYCSVGGFPGTWQQIGGPSAAGSFHLLPTPVRVYDSRPGSTPPNGDKTKLPAGGSRTLFLSANSSGVPQGAVAAAVTCLLVNTAPGAGNFTIWANGQPKPAANTMVWGGNAGRFSTPAITAIDQGTACRVSSSLSTDFVLDVVGYYL